MAHGIGGIKAAGLRPFAERFVAEGYFVVVFDYRHWGSSTGEPRELLDISRQLQDYRTAISFTASQKSVDPELVFAWGTSFAGMHIVELAATEKLAGAIAQCPLVDGLGAAMKLPLRLSLKLAGTAALDKIGSMVGRDPIYVPVAVEPGELGMLATSDSVTGMKMLVANCPVDWPNRITARSAISLPWHRPFRRAGSAKCPILMVVATHDTLVPTRPALRVAEMAPHGEMFRSSGGHFDVYEGGIAHSEAIEAEVAFLHRHSAESR